MRIRIATPMARHQLACPEHSEAVHQLRLRLEEDRGADVPEFGGYDLAGGHLIPARNVLLESALASSADVLLWIDADVAFTTPEQVIRMCWDAWRGVDDDPPVAIIGAPCASTPRARAEGAPAPFPLNYRPAGRLSPPWPAKVARIGLGLQAWPLAWWRGQLQAGLDPSGIDRAPGAFFRWIGHTPEDDDACDFATSRGALVFADARVTTWHGGQMVTGADDITRIIKP